jgi:hypothetical protein
MRSENPFEEFLQDWRGDLRSPKDWWDGRRAVAELRSAGYTVESRLLDEQSVRISMFDFVLCEPKCRWRPREMLSKILAEVEDYKKQKRAWEREYRNTEIFLAKIGRRTLLQSQRAVEDALKQLLKRTAILIEEQRIFVNKLRNPTQRSLLGAWERLWPHRTRKASINRKIDLDTRLQLQIAKMFRIFLHKDEGISLRTIARLVVLIYKVTELASPDSNNDKLVITGSLRSVTFRSVEEILRRNRINEQN